MMEIPKLYKIFQEHPIVTTDSRNCPKNSIFFALKGEHFNGNDYIEQAFQNGAAYAVSDQKDSSPAAQIIQVDDVLQTLQNLANFHRQQMETTIIAVTGTNGKTTTKELITAALSSKYSVLATQGNLNNHIGVPLTLLRLKPENEFAIIEMGANHPGEIRNLCRIAEPNFGLITNVGKAHLDGFGSFTGVVRTKIELYEFLHERGRKIFGNSDNTILYNLYDSRSVIRFGTVLNGFVRGTLLESSSFLKLKWMSERRETDMKENIIKTQLIGGYNFENVMAAICIASFFDVEDEKINSAIADYAPQNNRSQIYKTHKNQLILDSYNANPSSMKAALDNFILFDGFPKMAILGEMKELGSYSEKEHFNIISLLFSSKINKVILVGEEFLKINPILFNWKIFPNTDDLLKYLEETEFTGYSILLKGSRANQLEKCVALL